MAGFWGASWDIDSNGLITIFIQTSFYEACIAKHIEWELVHTVQHEYMEAKLAVKEAERKYPGKNPYVMNRKDPSLGGEAHDKTIRELDAISESEYDKWLDRILDYLGV